MEELSIKPKRSSFLNALCILTFIGCAFTLISGFYNHFTLDSKLAEMATQREAIEAKGGPAFAIEMMDSAEIIIQKQMANKNLLLALMVFGAVGCFIGAFMMYNLKKNGYFIYSFFEIVPSIVSLFILGFGGSTMAVISSAIALIVPITFIIMYGMNLKDMN